MQVNESEKTKMTEFNWQEFRNEACRVFASYPDAATEQPLLDVFERNPVAVIAAVEKIIGRVQAGKLHGRAGWMIVRREVENIGRPATDLVATDTGERDRAARLAACWIRNAGMHFDREAEIVDELFREK